MQSCGARSGLADHHRKYDDLSKRGREPAVTRRPSDTDRVRDAIRSAARLEVRGVVDDFTLRAGRARALCRIPPRSLSNPPNPLRAPSHNIPGRAPVIQCCRSSASAEQRARARFKSSIDRRRRAAWVVLAAAVQHGRRALWWSCPPWCFCRRSSSLSCAFSSVSAPCGVRERRARSNGRRARDARGARASRVVHHRRSRAGAFARCGLLLLGASLVLSVALRTRRSLAPPARRRGRAHHERARGARNARRDARGARGVARCALGVRGPCLRAGGRSVLRCSLLSAPRTPLPRSAPRLDGGTRTTSGRAAHTTRDARRARLAASPRAVRFPLSQFAVRAPGVFLGFALLPCASFRVPPCLFSRAGGRRLAKRARAMRVQPAHYAPLCAWWLVFAVASSWSGKTRGVGRKKRVELSQNAWSWAETRRVEPKRVELSETN